MNGRGPKPETWTHGRYGYANHGCRCETCVKDRLKYNEERMEERRKVKELAAAVSAQAHP